MKPIKYLLVLLLALGLTKTQAKPDSGIKIIILYDNYQYDEQTIADWGFACLIIKEKDTILFDTGAVKDILFHNLEKLNIDVSTIQTMIISHHHGDHAGNVFPLIEKNPDMMVYLPSTLDGKFREMVKNYGVRTVVDNDVREIAYNIFLSGEMGFQIREQALVIKTKKGLVLITGCGHAGIDRMIRKVENKFKLPVFMVIGGFHMEEYADEEIEEIIRAFRELGVEKVAPGHCTGQKAMEKFESVYQHNFIKSGTGKIIEI